MKPRGSSTTSYTCLQVILRSLIDVRPWSVSGITTFKSNRSATLRSIVRTSSSGKSTEIVSSSAMVAAPDPASCPGNSNTTSLPLGSTLVSTPEMSGSATTMETPSIEASGISTTATVSGAYVSTGSIEDTSSTVGTVDSASARIASILPNTGPSSGTSASSAISARGTRAASSAISVKGTRSADESALVSSTIATSDKSMSLDEGVCAHKASGARSNMVI